MILHVLFLCYLIQEPPFDSFLQTAFVAYKIEYSVAGTTKVDTISYPAQMHIITELMKGTYYFVRVALTNSAGEGEYSFSATGRTDVDRECLNVVCSHGALCCRLCDKVHTYCNFTLLLIR